MNEPGQPQFPIMAFQVTPQGMELVVLHSNLHKESFLVPQANADQWCISWLKSRPQEVLHALKEAVRQAQAERATLEAAVTNPHRLPIAMTRGLKG